MRTFTVQSSSQPPRMVGLPYQLKRNLSKKLGYLPVKNLLFLAIIQIFSVSNAVFYGFFRSNILPLGNLSSESV